MRYLQARVADWVYNHQPKFGIIQKGIKMQRRISGQPGKWVKTLRQIKVKILYSRYGIYVVDYRGDIYAVDYKDIKIIEEV